MSLVPLSPVCLALCPLYLCPYLSLSDALGVLVAGDGILVGERERAFGRLDVQCLLAFVWTSRPPINLNLLSSLSPPATSLLSSLYSHNPFPSYALSIFRIDYTTTPLASPPYTRPAPSSSASSSCIRPRPGRFRGLATGEHARKDYRSTRETASPGCREPPCLFLSGSLAGCKRLFGASLPLRAHSHITVPEPAPFPALKVYLSRPQAHLPI